jgi:hypothetical protein
VDLTDLITNLISLRGEHGDLPIRMAGGCDGCNTINPAVYDDDDAPDGKAVYLN